MKFCSSSKSKSCCSLRMLQLPVIQLSCSENIRCITYHIRCITYHIRCITYHIRCITYHIRSITYHIRCITYHIRCITHHIICITYHIRSFFLHTQVPQLYITEFHHGCHAEFNIDTNITKNHDNITSKSNSMYMYISMHGGGGVYVCMYLLCMYVCRLDVRLPPSNCWQRFEKKD